MKKILLILLFLPFIYIGPSFSQSSSSDNPVIIQYGDQQITRRQFELDFELMMVISAVQSGVPVKDPRQIMEMQQRYLSQRADELVLLDMAGQRGMSVSEAELHRGLNELMNDLGFQEYNRQNLGKLGIADEQQIQAYVRERLIITQLMLQFKSGSQVNETDGGIKRRIVEFSVKKGLETYPQYLRNPLDRRSDG